jgi:hypothetical protein
MISLQEKTVDTVEKGTYDLIKGDFSPEEAAEIMNDLFAKKINFHTQKGFGQLLRFGSKDPKSVQRISELELTQEQILELIAEANNTGKSLRVNSIISIELI